MSDGAATTTSVPDPSAARPTEDVLPPPHADAYSAVTHGVGCLLSLVAAAVLLSTASRRGGPWHVGACAVYAATMVAAYAASTLSHVFRSPRARGIFRVADQALIFLFIAGSWTPVAAAWLRDGWWWLFHAAVWAVALGGFVSKALFAHRVTMGTVSAVLYLVLGWSPVVVALPLARLLPAPLCGWLLAGGGCYTLGLLFFWYDDRVPSFHAVWHVLVMAGSACHYFGILHYCTGPRP